MTDKQLVGLLREEPEEGLRKIMERYGGAIHTICISILRGASAEDVEEAVSDVLNSGSGSGGGIFAGFDCQRSRISGNSGKAGSAAGDFRTGVSSESNPVRFHRTRCLDHGQDIGIAGMMVQKDREREEGYYAIGLLTLEKTKEQSPKKVTLELEDFGYIESGKETTEWVTLVPGTWTLELTLDCADVSQTYTVQKEFSTNSGTFCIESVRISPLSIKLTGNSDHLDAIMEDAQTSIEIEGFLMSDGTFQQLLTWSYTGPENGKLVLGGSFDQLLDPEQIAGVRILGEDLLFGDSSF